MRNEPAALDPGVASILERRSTPVFIAVRSLGKCLGEFWLEGETQHAALALGLGRVAEELGEHSSAATSAEVCLTHDFRTVDSADDQQWRRANFTATRGVLGIELAHQGLVERCSPITTLATNRSLQRLLQRFAEKHAIRPEHVRGSVRITRFRADQLLVLLEDEPRTIPMVRGARLVEPEEVTREETMGLVDQLGGFLANHVHQDGRMTYLYYPSRDSEDEDTTVNNMIRQWMATLALCRFARAKGDSALVELADRNIRFNLEHYYRCQTGLGLIEFRGQVKLGAVALAVLSLMEHERRQQYAEVESSLWRTIDHQRQQSGMWRTFVIPSERNDQTNLYPGAALLAWAHRIRETSDASLIERFMGSFQYYRRWHLDPKNRNPAFIPFQTQAYYIVYQVTGERQLADFIFEMNDWLVPFQRWPTRSPEFAGRFYDPKRPYGSPHASSTGGYLEGLGNAFELASELGDEKRRRRYATTISRGIRSIMQLTFREASDLYYSSQPERLVGGVRSTCYDNVIRIDNVQRNLLALLKIVSVFDEEDYATEPGATSSAAPEQLLASSPLELQNLRTLYGPNLIGETSLVVADLSLRAGTPQTPGFRARWSELEQDLNLGDTTELDGIASSDAPALPELAGLVGELASRLQAVVGFPASGCRVTPGENSDSLTVAVAFEYESLGRAALQLAAVAVAHTLAGSQGWQRRVQRQRADFEKLSRSLPDPERREIARRARLLGIRCERVANSPPVFRLGLGARQKLFELTSTSETSLVHSKLVSNKPEANRYFVGMGVPLARQLPAASPAEAVAAAKQLGFPVVTKPARGSGGRGVSANLLDEHQVRAGFERARGNNNRRVVVEQHLPGQDYRFLVIHGELVAVARRVPPHVVGDGIRTVRELVSSSNHERDREDGLWHTLKSYKIDEDTLRLLARAGLEVDSVPEQGRRVTLSSAANGGTTEHIDLATVHPDNREAACHAARVGGIDICGVDFLLPDPARSFRDTGGGICEVNFKPSLLLHMIVDDGRSLTTVDRFVKALIRDDAGGNVPVAVLAGAGPALVDSLTSLLGPRGVARVDERGVFLGDYRIARGHTAWPQACRMTLFDPSTTQAVVSPNSGDIRDHGLWLERCASLVWGDPKRELTPEFELAREHADTVVRWDSTEWSEPGPERTVICSVDVKSQALAEHVAKGGRAVVLESDGRIVTRSRYAERALGKVQDFSDESESVTLLAAGAAWALLGDIEALAEAFASAETIRRTT